MRLLGLLLLHPGGEWTVDKLARTLKAPPPSVHRELHRALDAGVVEREEATRPHRYRGVQESPVHDPLYTLLERTVGLDVELEEHLAQAPGVEVALIHGSWAAGKLSPGSDVDVLVIGHPDVSSLRKAVRRVGRRAGRSIDLSVLEPDVFRSGLREGNGFLRKLVAGPRKSLVGDLEAWL